MGIWSKIKGAAGAVAKAAEKVGGAAWDVRDEVYDVGKGGLKIAAGVVTVNPALIASGAGDTVDAFSGGSRMNANTIAQAAGSLPTVEIRRDDASGLTGRIGEFVDNIFGRAREVAAALSPTVNVGTVRANVPRWVWAAGIAGVALGAWYLVARR